MSSLCKYNMTYRSQTFVQNLHIFSQQVSTDSIENENEWTNRLTLITSQGLAQQYRFRSTPWRVHVTHNSINKIQGPSKCSLYDLSLGCHKLHIQCAISWSPLQYSRLVLFSMGGGDTIIGIYVHLPRVLLSCMTSYASILYANTDLHSQLLIG